jgi:hypothetical protein
MAERLVRLAGCHGLHGDDDRAIRAGVRVAVFGVGPRDVDLWVAGAGQSRSRTASGEDSWLRCATGRRSSLASRSGSCAQAAASCRVTDDDFHAEMIGSFFAFFAGLSLPGARRWAARCRNDFVEQAIAYSPAVAGVPDRASREQAWRHGLCRGAQAAGGLRPGRSPEQIAALLAQVCHDAAQAPIRVP